ncbi:aspartate aminotransferase, cytoplasmic-like [Corticium candelabrum]|uniref:aspartate aminotransferase, cytoplasmic-like n=1 Tax=Corticium candelabrum TaxID=121492 RepID=UPI002E256EA3|nr:aspartate aminotransferase, cytoplasmic-like [Corticium candelabrum]
MSFYGNVELACPDTIFDLRDAYNADSHPYKVNLGIGAYRDSEGKPWVLPVVRQVEASLAGDLTLNHEYLPIDGLRSFTDAALRLLLGSNSTSIVEGRACAVQSLSGTGGLRLAAEFLLKFHDVRTVYVSRPTWQNHHHIFKSAGFRDIREYRYYSKLTKGLDFAGLLDDLKNAPRGSIVILHACAHNPTGVDPSHEQWEEIRTVCEQQGLCALFDCAYQGFTTGDVDRDAWAVRHFAGNGLPVLCSMSFSKNFGLYNERAGVLALITGSPQEETSVRSQLKQLIRGTMSNPPSHGARIVATVLNNPALFDEWKGNIQTMSTRIAEMRRLLYEKLLALGTPGNWIHILDHIGMFTFSGLEPNQVEHMKTHHHIYLLANGRINMSAITPQNADYVAKAINETVTKIPFEDSIAA